MKNITVRLTGIVIKNFKNLKSCTIDLTRSKNPDQADVLCLYGPNGSGKSAVINTIEILQGILSGKSLPPKTADFININADSAELEYAFDISVPDENYKLWYACSLRKNDAKRYPDDVFVREEQPQITVCSETLNCASGNTGNRKNCFIDTRTSGVFTPSASYNLLIGNDKNTRIDLLAAKKMAEQESRSFIFSRELMNAIEKNRNPEDKCCHPNLLETLADYGQHGLFVTNEMKNADTISLLPLAFKHTDKIITAELATLSMDKPSVIPAESSGTLKDMIENMNAVLNQIIPGLAIRIRESGSELLRDGTIGKRIQLYSCRNEMEIPLKYESDGIRKIIRILPLMIAAYDDSSVTAAIDDPDAYLSEHVLTELVRKLSENGKGQLVFASHSRYLSETLDPDSILVMAAEQPFQPAHQNKRAR